MRRTVAMITLAPILICVLMSIFGTLQTKCVQPPESEWAEEYGGSYGDTGYQVLQTPDGGYAISCYTNRGSVGQEDFYLVRTYANGTMKWDKTYATNLRDVPYNLIQTNDGGFALAGYTGSYNHEDFWLVKTDSSGNHEWNKTYGGSQRDIANVIIQTSDGGYVIAGETSSYGAGSIDFWMVKTDVNGDVQWSRTYGGSGQDFAAEAVQTVDGGYALFGWTMSFGAGGRDFWLVKTDVEGNELWNKTYGDTLWEEGFFGIQTNDGGYAMLGWTESYGAGGEDFWLVKTDSSGNHQWNKTYGGMEDERGYCVVQTIDGEYALAGNTRSLGAGGEDFWLVKTDVNGIVLWNQTYGGTNNDSPRYIIQTHDKGYALTGYFGFNSPNENAWLIKLAPTKIAATVDVDPDTLNLKSKGEWLTGYVELPEGYDVNDIDTSTILLNGTVSAEERPTGVGDEDNDGVPDLMVKFDRANVKSYILANIDVAALYQERSMNITLTVTGNLNDGTLFEGTDTIRIMMPGTSRRTAYLHPT